MIISRRKVHLFTSIALAVILPIIFVASLVFRPTYATVTPDTDQLLSQVKEPGAVAELQDASAQNPIAAFLKE